ncbi:MAG: FecR family protein [Saprospiraceae bacterium]
MNQHEFDKLLEKYLTGACNAEQEKLIRDWQENQLRNSPLELEPEEKNKIQSRLWKKIAGHTVAKTTSHSLSRSRYFLLKGSIAASLLIVIACAYFLFLSKENRVQMAVQQIASSGDIEVKNTSKTSREIMLEDGTIVLLKEKSSVSYPEHFGDKTRNIYLKGEAFFKIKRNPSLPFLVHTGELVTEVLGTMFNVKSYEESNAIEVSVVSGRVSVYEASDKPSNKRNGVILTPNQKMVFDKKSKKLTSGIVENPLAIIPPTTKIQFIFEETPIKEVLEKLSTAYGLEIVVENHDLYRCVLNADLNDLSLTTQLDLICKSVNANYEQRGTGIFINGKGCK